MTREAFDALCAQQKGAVLSGDGELDAWKVAGKMFACFGHSENRAQNIVAVSVKCPDKETAEMLIEAGAARKAAYFHQSWVSLDLAALETSEALHRIETSHSTICKSLTKSVREAL